MVNIDENKEEANLRNLNTNMEENHQPKLTGANRDGNKQLRLICVLKRLSGFVRLSVG